MPKCDIANALGYFAKYERPDLATQRGPTLAKQLKTVSAKGYNSPCWADNFFWPFYGDGSSLKATSLRALAEVIESIKSRTSASAAMTEHCCSNPNVTWS
nr:hypothetical protein FFPRI1PSEUD_33320 [Pseudomonas sp. FFPRI_1]